METSKVIIQIVTAMFGTLGFCLMFHIERKHLLAPTIGGGICWGAYLLFIHLGKGIFMSSFLASAIVGIYGVSLSRIRKAPTTVFFIPCAVPLVPGSNLYYMLVAMMAQNWPECKHNAILLALYAVSISLGLGIVVEMDYIRRQIKLQRRERLARKETAE